MKCPAGVVTSPPTAADSGRKTLRAEERRKSKLRFFHKLYVPISSPQVEGVELIPSRRQWNEWSLPSKLTAIGTLVGALSLGLYLGEKSLGILRFVHRAAPSAAPTIPPVVLALENTTAELIRIQRRGDFVLWLPQGIDGIRRLPGRYDLEVPEGGSSDPVVAIAPGAEARVLAQLHSEVPLTKLLDAGAADIEFILRREDGGLFFSGSIPFKRESVTTTRWTIDLARKE